MNSAQVIIVGAGIAGLVAAHELEAQGISVILLDKSTSTGGRLATRRIGDGVADHGAQFFTVRTNTFQRQVDQWLADDIVTVWSNGWTDGSLKRTVGDGHPRYIAKGGMNRLARHIEETLKTTRVQVNARVTDIRRTTPGFELETDDGQKYVSDAVILTPPAPQSLDLMRHLPLLEADQEQLERIHYGPCLCGLHVIEGDVNLPEPGALQDFNQTVYWIGDNKAKGISNVTVITTHAESRWSRQYYDEADDVILGEMRAALKPYLGDNAKIIEEQVKRWRYSVPLTTHPADSMTLGNMALVLAGDGFGGRGRVEGAYLSGLHAAKQVIHMMTVES